MSTRQDPLTDPREDALLALLAATESLAAAMAAGEVEDAWVVFLDGREAAFHALVQAISTMPRAEQPLTATARACLDRIEALDAELLSAGRSQLDRLQRERLDLGRRRQAVKAHGVHERNLARAVAVKA